MKTHLFHSFWLIAAAGFGFALYCALLASGLFADSTILFYRGLALAAVAALAAGGIGAFIARKRGTAPLAMASALSCFSVSVCFLVLFPVTIDRSVSVYLLATIERQGPEGISPADLEGAFLSGYVRDMRAIDRRIAEQELSGNVVQDAEGKVRLTGQGHRFVALSRSAAHLLGTDRRFVQGYPAVLQPTTATTPPQ
jgi:hypothetical protein